ncbi:MAG: stage 0 sporulation family protein [Anaerolineae bacterium]
MPELEPGDYVSVETRRGRQMGQIIGWVDPADASEYNPRPIKAPATPRDMMMKMLYEAKEVEALVRVRELAVDMHEFEVVGAKFVKVSYNYDGSVLSVLYTSEEQVDTGRLRRKLNREFTARIDMRRIGSRDAAKLIGEYGACGAPRCCSTHLTEFSPISIKMAKAQGVSLNPSEITGMCGRLRCCLIYEYEQYLEARKNLPRTGKRVGTPHGAGKVIALNPLADQATVLIEGQRHEVDREDIIPMDEYEALQAKAAAGCSKEGEGGVCDCGARIRGEASPQGKSSSRSEERSSSKDAGRKKRRRRTPGKRKRKDRRN